jgi:hydroxymethylbilane synthase
VQAERGFLAALGGGCNVPLGAYATAENGAMTLRAFVADADGTRLLRAQKTGPDPAALGQAVAGELLSRGAAALLGR